MDFIKLPISTELVTGFKRQAKHESFVILPDLQMVQQVRVITVDAAGHPLLERILADDSLSAEQRQALGQRYADQIVTRQTTGAFVDTTGLVVEPREPGAIPQRSFFQAITLGDLKKQGLTITDKTTVASLIYALIGQEITNIDNRGGL
ncbi:hypothetical protein GGR92_003664 [Spirosoma lacussanchae]|uniref:hypothetical protein n=1 Tax=Spirosoma lacussanchae TaxID=1884249 RepID=UPI0011083EAC|nr:hypothetical protein [Spirosoma lacussanchae]